MGSCTLVCLGRRTVQGEENQDRGQRTEGHRQGKEGARALQYGQRVHIATERFRGWGDCAMHSCVWPNF